jgi:outer membrane protein assembly factor BamB
LATFDGYPAAFNLTKGEKLWQWEDKAIVYGAEPETVYVVRPDKRLYALDSQTGQTKWKTVFGELGGYSPDWPLWTAQNTVCLPFSVKRGSHFWDLPFATIDKKTGYILWGHEGAKICAQTDKTLLAAKYQRWVGFDLITGREKWTRSHLLYDDDMLENSPHVSWQTSKNSLFYLKPNPSPSLLDKGQPLIAVDIDSGQTLWENKEEYVTIEALFPNRIYVTRYDDDQLNLIVLDPQTGKKFWTWPDFALIWEGTRVRPGYHFVGELEEMTIISHRDLGYTYGVEASTGKTLWMNDDLRLSRLVGISKNTLIGVYQPSFLFGLNPATGERKWRLELSEVTHKVILFGDKLIYGSGQALAVLDPETGKSISIIPLPDRPTRLAPQKDFLLAQTGAPGGLGTLSAVRI